MTDTETEILERFVIEVSQIGTVDHIIDMEAEPVGRSAYSPRRELLGEKLCDRSTRSPASEYIDLPRYADWKGLDKTAFEGDAPDGICSYCWAATLETIDQLEQNISTGAESQIGTAGYRLRWKQKGRAREEWYDIVVRPETTIAELDRLVCRFSTLDDLHLRMYGLEDEYLDSTLNVLPDHQYEEVDDSSYTNASDVTIGDIAERTCSGKGIDSAWSTTSERRHITYCIVKEVYDPDEIDDLLAESDTIAATGTAAIIDEKRP